jgi:hypothetical protein
MIACLALGFRTVRARRVRSHRAWMIRAYALGLGAGTQVVTIGLAEATLGASTSVIDAATAAGWAVNLAIAEAIVRRQQQPPTRRALPTPHLAQPAPRRTR